MEIDLTRFELFKSFTEFDIDDLVIDLHNCFDCQSVVFSSSHQEFRLAFKANMYSTNQVREVEIVFSQCYISKLSLNNRDQIESDNTIDIMYRSRFENGIKDLIEISEEGRYHYYVEFTNELCFELFAEKLSAIILFED